MPDLYIITGSNGAGKSTFGINYLPPHIASQCSIFDGDKLFYQKRRELYPSKAKSHKEARNMAAEWLEEHFVSLVNQAIESGDNFVYEGHFSSDGPWQTPRRFKSSGYTIHLIFFGLADPGLSMLRVIERSKSGGHYVNEIEVDHNYHGNLLTLDQNFYLLNEITLFDTSATAHLELLHVLNGKVISKTSKEQLPYWFTSHLRKLTAQYF